jgi:hypothetical protein
MGENITTLTSLLTAASIILAVWHDRIQMAATGLIPAKKANRKGYRKAVAGILLPVIVISAISITSFLIYFDEALVLLMRARGPLEVSDTEKAFVLLTIVMMLVTAYANLLLFFCAVRLFMSFVSPDKIADF